MPIKERVADLWTKIALFISSSTAMLGALSLSDWAALIGIVCTVVVSVYSIAHKRRQGNMVRDALRKGMIDCAMCDKVQG